MMRHPPTIGWISMTCLGSLPLSQTPFIWMILSLLHLTRTELAASQMASKPVGQVISKRTLSYRLERANQTKVATVFQCRSTKPLHLLPPEVLNIDRDPALLFFYYSDPNAREKDRKSQTRSQTAPSASTALTLLILPAGDIG